MVGRRKDGRRSTFALLRQNAPWLATGTNGEESPPKL